MEENNNKTSPFYRAKLSCKVARDALKGKRDSIPDYEYDLRYAVFCLAGAIEDIAEGLETVKTHDELKGIES